MITLWLVTGLLAAQQTSGTEEQPATGATYETEAERLWRKRRRRLERDAKDEIRAALARAYEAAKGLGPQAEHVAEAIKETRSEIAPPAAPVSKAAVSGLVSTASRASEVPGMLAVQRRLQEAAKAVAAYERKRAALDLEAQDEDDFMSALLMVI